MDNSKEVLSHEELQRWEYLCSTKGTRWNNPLDTPQRVKLIFGNDNRNEVTVTIPARGAAVIPKMFDYAVHRVHHGVCIGGMAPLLVKQGQTYVVSKALIPVRAVSTTTVAPSDIAAAVARGATQDEDAFLARARKAKGQ